MSESKDVDSGVKSLDDFTQGLKALGNSAHNEYQQAAVDATLLERFPNPMTVKGTNSVFISIPEFTSLCPLTGQPDFATIEINYEPDAYCVESKALKLYIVSFRNHGSFHEECCNTIAMDLIALLNPKKLSVKGLFTPRGGIPFHPYIRYVRDGIQLSN